MGKPSCLVVSFPFKRLNSPVTSQKSYISLYMCKEIKNRTPSFAQNCNEFPFTPQTNAENTHNY